MSNKIFWCEMFGCFDGKIRVCGSQISTERKKNFTNYKHLIIEPSVKTSSINYSYHKMIAFNDTQTQTNGFFLLSPPFSSSWKGKLCKRKAKYAAKFSTVSRNVPSLSLCLPIFFLGYISPPPELPNTHKFSFQLLIHMLDWNELLLSIVVCELFGLTVNTSGAEAAQQPPPPMK